MTAVWLLLSHGTFAAAWWFQHPPMISTEATGPWFPQIPLPAPITHVGPCWSYIVPPMWTAIGLPELRFPIAGSEPPPSQKSPLIHAGTVIAPEPPKIVTGFPDEQ